MIELPKYLQSKIQPEPNTGCWLWLAAVDGAGYGHVGVPNTGLIRKAHRLVYEFYKEPIPEGLVLNHLCRVRTCVNPDHLEITTHRDNILKGEGNAAKNALKTICCNGHSLADAYITRLRNGQNSRKCKVCHDGYMRRYNARKAIKGETTP